MELRELTIDGLFREAAEKYGGAPALRYGERRWSWRELDALVERTARRLEELGIRAGERVGIWGLNSDGWIVTFLALQRLGAVTALLNAAYLRRELVQVLRIGDISWLCCGETPALAEDAALLSAAASRLGGSLRGVFDFSEGRLPLDAAPLAPRSYPAGDPNATACLLYTSGTTREPKCAQHTHRALVNNAIVSAERTEMGTADRLCLSQPLFHMFGFAAGFLASVWAGTEIAVLSRFGSEDILRCVEAQRCTILNGVPTNFLRLLSNPAFPRYSTASLRLSVIGGAPVSEAQLGYIREAFPTAHIMTNYGLTEGCCLTNSERADTPAQVARTVGRPYPHIELAIRDPETRAFLPAGQRGEIVARGYSVMQGYYRPQSCEQPVDDEGWLHTEDLGVLDADGRLAVVGRIKDIIIRGGEDITPAEVRQEILRYEPIRDALVLGAPHPVLGEEVVACVTLETPEDYSERELCSLLRHRLAPFKLPAFVLVYGEFPLKPNGKVDRRALRADMCEKVRAFHEGDARYNITPQMHG